MPSFWAYAPVPDGSDFEQGDFVEPTTQLREVLEQVHRHFCDEKYLGFLVLTQTCDLARRRGAPPAARYINIAAVRSLEAVLPKLVSTVCPPVTGTLYRMSGKQKAHNLLHRVIHQNERKLGLFYLHPDADWGIGEPAVAILQVSVALRADHYEILQSARKGRLNPDFQAKLGWLVGNLYARPATPDWEDQPGGKAEAKRLLNDLLDAPGQLEWIDDASVDAAREAGVSIDGLTGEAAVAALKKLKPSRPLDEGVEIMLSALSDVIPQTGAGQIRRLRQRLKNDERLRVLLRPR